MTTTLSAIDALNTLDLPEKPDVTKSPREVEQYLARTENPQVLPHPRRRPCPRHVRTFSEQGRAARRLPGPPSAARPGLVERSRRRAAGGGTAQCHGLAARPAQ